MFPQAVPEIPVSVLATALEYYVRALGFQVDWRDEESGIAGVSQGACRMFLTSSGFRRHNGAEGSLVVWLNLESRGEVDELFRRWQAAGARILAEPEDKPWNLREFRAVDLDGNELRVFYDFTGELRAKSK